MEQAQNFKFPEELRRTISSLKNEKQWEILEVLLSNNNELSYTNLREKIGLSTSEKGDLNYHIKELEKGGWLRNVVKSGSDIADKHSSYYSISKFALKLIEGILKAMDRRSYLQDPYHKIKEMSFVTPSLGYIFLSGTKDQQVITITQNGNNMQNMENIGVSNISKYSPDGVAYKLQIPVKRLAFTEYWKELQEE
jgi:DNA-binding MarR family transcriptional regulator